MYLKSAIDFKVSIFCTYANFSECVFEVCSRTSFFRNSGKGSLIVSRLCGLESEIVNAKN